MQCPQKSPDKKDGSNRLIKLLLFQFEENATDKLKCVKIGTSTSQAG